MGHGATCRRNVVGGRSPTSSGRSASGNIGRNGAAGPEVCAKSCRVPLESVNAALSLIECSAAGEGNEGQPRFTGDGEETNKLLVLGLRTPQPWLLVGTTSHVLERAGLAVSADRNLSRSAAHVVGEGMGNVHEKVPVKPVVC